MYKKWWLNDMFWQVDMETVMRSHNEFITKQTTKDVVNFHGIRIEVGAGVYHPTKGSSTDFIAKVLKKIVRVGDSVLDMGSGCGALALLCVFHGAVSALAVDASSSACESALRNTIALDMSDKVTVIKSDLFENVPDKKFDLIVFNAPLLNAKPISLINPDLNHMAIDYHGELLKRFVTDAIKYLSIGGRLVVLVSNIGHRGAVKEISDQMSMIGEVEVLSYLYNTDGHQWRILLSIERKG